MNSTLLFLTALARSFLGRATAVFAIEVPVDGVAGWVVTEVRVQEGPKAIAARLARAYVGRCKACKNGLRLDGLVPVAMTIAVDGTRSARHEVGAIGAGRVMIPSMDGSGYRARCACGGVVKLQHVSKVKVTEHVCGAKCMSSKGPSCDCSCGGKNHGRAWIAI